LTTIEEAPLRSDDDQPVQEERLRSWIADELSEILGISAAGIDPHRRFRAFGLESAQATQLVLNHLASDKMVQDSRWNSI